VVLTMMACRLSGGEREVTAAEVNGTYRHNESEIKVLAVAEGKLKLQLNLVYMHDAPGGPTANVGDASGKATIERDTATLALPDFPDCKIAIAFLPDGKLKVEQSGDCGFGHNVRADGTFTKVSSRKPKFDE
jgi:hypothetical protein